MFFFRNLIHKQWLKRRSFVGILLAIATSLLLILGIPWLQKASAQLPLKPFSGESAPKLASVDRIISLVDRDRDRLVTIFKDIHQNPELGFMETRTAAIVAKELSAHECRLYSAFQVNRPHFLFLAKTQRRKESK